MTGIILAGGKSKRFGGKIDKALLPLNNKPTVQWIIEKLNSFFPETILVTNQPENFSQFPVKLVSDIYPGYAALSGLHSGLHYSKNFYNFVVACDLPFVLPELIRCLVKNKENYDIVIPWLKTGQEPFCAIYSKNCLQPISEQIKKGAKPRIIDFLKEVKLLKIKEEEIKKIDPDLISFFNINTPKDYRKAQQLAKKFLSV